MDLLSLLGFITSFLGGGFVSGFVTYYLTSRRAEREVLRGKLESVYREFSVYSRRVHIGANNVGTYLLKRKYDKDTEYNVDQNVGELDLDSLGAKIEIYFPCVSSSYVEYIRAMQKIHGIGLDVYIGSMGQEVDDAPQALHAAAVKVLLEKSKCVMHKLLVEAAKINRPFWNRKVRVPDTF